MDLGSPSLDLGSTSMEDLEKKENHVNEAVTATVKFGKSHKALKETGQSMANALNKFTAQIKKPPHRKTSPLNWFPRKKTDSYLNRKIKLLQEVGGMNSTLDETLGDSNPHYSRVLREKIAAKEAAQKAMEARKAALVEASWCRILKAARIQSKEAEAMLCRAEKVVAEAFEAARAKGVVMYDMPNCSRKPCEIETSSVNGGGSTTHTVTASFETAFEVDKEVAAAVKTALVRLAHCPFSKDEFKEVLWKISQNPDTGEKNELSGFSSEYESDTGLELELESQKDVLDSQDLNCAKSSGEEATQRKYKKRQVPENFNAIKLVDVMLERLKLLKEDELDSLATIVATCGLNAALAEAEINKPHDVESGTDCAAGPTARRMSSFGTGTSRTSSMQYFMDGQMRKKGVESQLPSLGECLVKHMSNLEREVLKAKKTIRNESKDKSGDVPNKSDEGKGDSDNKSTLSKTIPDFGSILVKHSSKFEKEIGEAKKNSGELPEMNCKNLDFGTISSEVIPDLGSALIMHSSKLEKEIDEAKQKCQMAFENNDEKSGRMPSGAVRHTKQDALDVPSLDKFLVKHVSRLEREVQEANSRRKNCSIEGGKVMTQSEQKHKEGANHTEQGDVPSLDKFLVKHVSRLEREVQEAKNKRKTDPIDGGGGMAAPKKKVNSLSSVRQSGEDVGGKENIALNREADGKFETERDESMREKSIANCESLDKVLVKHISRLEREKMKLCSEGEVLAVKRGGINQQSENEGGLDQILVKHKSKLEKEKMAAAQQPEDHIKYSLTRRELRERELQEAWGGLSLANSIRPHLSKLERDKAAWIKAEDEEKRLAVQEF